MHHTHAIPLSTFGPLRPSQTSIGYELFSPRNGHAPPYFPAPMLDPLGPGDGVTFTVPVPPGISLVSWHLQPNNETLLRSANGGPEVAYQPTLWPVGYNAQADNAVPVERLQPATRLEWTSFTARAQQPGTLLLALSVTWTIADAALYEAWRANGAVPVPAPPSTPAPHPAPEHQNLADRTLARAYQSGLVDALKALTGIPTDEALGRAAMATGVWDALVEHTRLAEVAQGVD